MPIEFQCPRCNSLIRVGDETAGRKGRCPQCKGKLRVPEVPAPSAAAPPAAEAGPAAVSGPAMIEFQCARCSAVIRVPASGAGKKGACPQCKGRLRVPELPGAPAEAAAAAVSAAAPPLEEAIPQMGPATKSVAKAVKRRQKMNKAALLMPVGFLAVFVGVAAWFFTEKPQKLEGSLTAERLGEPQLPAKVVDPEFILIPRRQLLPILKFLTEPLRLTSNLVGVEFVGGSKLEVRVKPGTDTELYRVDPRTNKALAAYLVANSTEFEKPRRKELAEAVPKFLKELETFRKAKSDAHEKLAEYRNSVGVASLVNSAGYQLEAVRHGESYHCIYEDAQGQLYFLLPIGTDQFEIRGRTSAKGPALFPGHYKVTVAAKAAAAKPAKPGKKKAKKAPPAEGESSEEKMEDG